MKLTIAREQLLQGLQFVTGVVERRQNMPILANVLLRLEDGMLAIIGTDLEIELTCRVPTTCVMASGATTVAGRKFIDICKALPEESEVLFQVEANKATISAGKSRFSLATLPAADFPVAAIEAEGESVRLSVPSADLNKLLESTYFAMAQQDVRYYLNGLFFELTPDSMRTVATDGHRLALRGLSCPQGVTTPAQFIVPRKGVLELLRLLNKNLNEDLVIEFGANAIKITAPHFVFVSRLVDGRFPDYHRAIPKNGDREARVDRDLLRQVLQRVAILSSEKYHAVRLQFQAGTLSIHANNTEQEEAYDEIALDYAGPSVEIGFNFNYLLDVLGAMPVGSVRIIFSTGENSVLIESEQLPGATFVIMPMCL